MAMMNVDGNNLYQRTNSQSRLAWYEGWRIGLCGGDAACLSNYSDHLLVFIIDPSPSNQRWVVAE